MKAAQIRKLSLKERRSTFNEVSLGLGEEQALQEAKRCLQCKAAPCTQGCPAGIDVKSFIKSISEKDYASAIRKIKEKNSLPGVCGRVCPQEDQCQKACVLSRSSNPIQIGYLERFVADYGMKKLSLSSGDPASGRAKKVAVIGSGPAGLTCAAELAKSGLEVHVFEALHKPGGVLTYGIPEFRLPKAIVEDEVKYIEALGVKMRLDFVAGKTKSLDELRQEGFKAFFISVGAGLPSLLGIPGESSNGVYSANEFLTRVNLMKGYLFPEYDTPVDAGARAGIIGAGNVAFDCARCALRMGAQEVTIIYRRTKEEMPAREEEILNAQEEGVRFQLLSSPVKISASDKGWIKSLTCARNSLGEPDRSGRRSPVPIGGSDFDIPLDTLIIAAGTGANPLFLSSVEGLELSDKGYIKVNSDFQSSIADIFAGGDIVSGSATVISAIQHAKTASAAIIRFLG